jgi:hypothetical protein
MERGNGTGKHARQPEGPTGERERARRAADAVNSMQPGLQGSSGGRHPAMCDGGIADACEQKLIKRQAAATLADRHRETRGALSNSRRVLR